MSTIANLYNHLKTLCQQWFYTKTEMDTELDSLQGQIDDLEYSDIGGTLVDVTSGIQADGLSDILNQIIGVLNTLNPPSVETTNITVTSATSGSNYFSGGTREITAVKYGKTVQVYVNFYNVNAKASSTSTDTTIGTLPTGWQPKISSRTRPAINNNTNLQYSQLEVTTNGEIRIRIGSTTAISGGTIRGTMTFITA